MVNMQVSNYYDEKYFAWEKEAGEFGGRVSQTKFSRYISKDDDVLDFGCGGGYLLKNINCNRKVGIEPSKSAFETAEQNGLEMYLSTDEVPDEYVDVIISDNALEHTLRPLDELKALWPKLRFGGKLIFIVPCENISYSYKPNHINHHLYSWSPMCLGNLVTEAGYHIIESKPYIHKWPPYYQLVLKITGRRIFEMICRITGRIRRSWFQVRVVAVKTPQKQKQ